MILVPSGINWREYLKNADYFELKYHLLYPVSTSNILYLSINPSYKKLPKLKLDAICSSIKLNFSNNKIMEIINFTQKLPLPDIPKLNTNANSFSIQATHDISKVCD